MIKFHKIFFPLLVLSIIWAVKIFEISSNISLYKLGIYPRCLSCIFNIFTAPFIHGNLSHIYFNSIYWLIFSVAVFYLYPKRAYLYMASSFIDTGFLLWIIGRKSYHIGLSGVIYALASFLFFSNLFAKDFRKSAISLAMIFLFAGMAQGFFPKEQYISWEAHISGAIIGFLLAIIEYKFEEYEDKEYRKKLYKDYT